MFRYLQKKLGLCDLVAAIDRMPVLNKRYLELLTPLEALFARLNQPEGDDTLIMHHLRCMGYFGGWKIREEYLKGHQHAIGTIKCINCGSNSLKAVWLPSAPENTIPGVDK